MKYFKFFLFIILLFLFLLVGCSDDLAYQSAPEDISVISESKETVSLDKAEIVESTEFGIPDESILKKAVAGNTIPYDGGVIVLKDNSYVSVEVLKDYDPTAKGATLLCEITGRLWSDTVTGELIVSCVYDDEWIPVYVNSPSDVNYPLLANATPKLTEQSFRSLILSHSSSDHFIHDGSYSGSYSYNRHGQKISLSDDEISAVVINEAILFDNGHHAYCSGSFVCTKEISEFKVSWRLLLSYNSKENHWNYEKITYTSEEINTLLPPAWTGTYQYSQKMGVDLILEEQLSDGTSVWLLSFYPLPGDTGESGSYRVKGTVQAGNMHVSLMDSEWVDQPQGYFMLPINGTFDPETNHISTVMYQFELDAQFDLQQIENTLAAEPDPVETSLPGYITEAICANYDLLDPKEITQEMLDSVTSLRIALGYREYIGDNPDSEEFVKEDYIYHIYATVNSSPFGCWGPYIRPNRYENLYLKQLEKDEYLLGKFESEYTLKTQNDPQLTEKGLQEMLSKYPMLKYYNTLYIRNPSINSRRHRENMQIIVDYVYADDNRLVSDPTIDLSCLSRLKNLLLVEYFIDTDAASTYESMEEYLLYNGLTFENCPVPILEKKGDLKIVD